MGIEELASVGIILKNADPLTVLEAEAAFDWMSEHTTLEFEKGNVETISALPACAKLFVVKFCEAMRINMGVASQSIEGLSITFRDADRNALLWQLANTLLGSYIKSQVRVIPARRRW